MTGRNASKIGKARATEADITKAIRSLLDAYGIFHWKQWQGPMSQPKGVSDIIGIYRGKFLAIEVKTERGKLTDAQRAFLDRVNREGGIAFVARSVEDVIRELKLPGLLKV
jgi:Holliday junction resolvase